MSDTEPPIDMLDDAPEGDAVEQQQNAGDAGPVSGTDTSPATAGDAAEQGRATGDATQ